MAADKTILAVAVGNSNSSSSSKVIKDANSATLNGVRPYIKGMIGRLHEFGYDIGDANQYVIDYRQCTESQLNQNFTVTSGLPTSYVILGMSKTVVDAAVNFTTAIPIIGMVSAHTGHPNLTGVSAQRYQIARRYYDHFLETVPSLSGQKVYILSRQGYPPSDASLTNIKKGGHLPVPIEEVAVGSPYGDNEINSAINGISGRGGLLILPVDYFFAAAGNIISWAQAKGLSDFWPVTDWVQHTLPSALGGHGASQERCGQLLADKIESIWSSGGQIPPFTNIHSPENFLWQASQAAANQLRVALGTTDV
jgi:hypothetical protein